MKKYLFLIFIPVVLWGQQVELSGYFEPQFMGLKMGSSFYQLASNKIRVDISKSLTARARVGANFNYISYHGKSQWAITDYLPRHISESLSPFQQNYLIFQFGDMAQYSGPLLLPRPERFYLDNAYLRMSFSFADFTIGRQQISPGNGYTWNPTDLFNTKDILDPTYEQPGHNAFRMDIPFTGNTTLTVLYSPGEKWNNSARMARLKTTLGHFDVSGITMLKDWSVMDYLGSIPAPATYKRWMTGADMAGELFGLGVWMEGAYNNVSLIDGPAIDGIRDFYELVAGTDYTFQSGSYIMAEWYYNTMAPSDWRQYSLNNWMWYFDATLKSLSKNQAMILFQYPASDFITTGVMTISSLSDKSIAIVPMIQWSIFEDVELVFYGNLYAGKEGRTFSSNLGNGGLVRLRAYL